MRDANVYFDMADTSDAAFDWPIEITLISLMAFAPLALGAVQAWSEAGFIFGALALAMLLAIKLLVRPDVQFVRSWTYWPIALFLALVAFQLVPLPAGLVRSIAPATHFLKDKFQADLPGANERLKWMSLSFYREGTLHDLRLILALICVYIVVINCIRRVSQIRRILAAIVIIAGVFAIVSLAQVALGERRIYGWIEMPTGQVARSGPFINHSHFGQFMNLSIGAAIGLALVHVNQLFRRDNYSPHEVSEKLHSRAMRPIWGLLFVIVLAGGAMMLSLSRGAMLGGAVAGVVVGTLLLMRKGMYGRVWMLGAIALCVIVVALLHADRLLDRLTQPVEKMHGDRMEIIRGLKIAVQDFPIFGAGLGTFSMIFPMYDRSNTPVFATHAENEYAQLVAETGLLGALMFLAFAGIIFGAMVRAVRGREMSPASSAAIGLMFGLIAIAVHSGTDFGQHIPAVALLTTVMCALTLNLAQLRWRELGRVSTSLPSRGNLFGRVGAVAAIVGVTVWMGFACYSTIAAESAWNVVKRMDKHLKSRQWDADSAQYADIITAAEVAAKHRPGNLTYHYWLNFYRWKSVTARPVENPLQYFPKLIDELHAGRWLCPLHGPTYLLAARLEGELPDRAEQAAKHLRYAFQLSGPDPEAAFLVAWLDAREGNIDQAQVRLRRAAELDRSLVPSVIDVCVHGMKRPELALQLAADDIDALMILVDVLSKDPNHQALAEEARGRAFSALQAKAEQPHAPAKTIVQFADALVERGRLEEAIAPYRRALSFDFGQTEWRMRLANSLAKLGRNDEAIAEAERVLQRRELREARELIDRLRKLAATRATQPK